MERASDQNQFHFRQGLFQIQIRRGSRKIAGFQLHAQKVLIFPSINELTGPSLSCTDSQVAIQEYTMVIPEGTLTNEGATDKDNLGTTYLAKQNFDFEQIYRTSPTTPECRT